MTITFEWAADSQMEAARDAARIAEFLPVEPHLLIMGADGGLSGPYTARLMADCSVDEFCDNLMAADPLFDEPEPSPDGDVRGDVHIFDEPE